MFIRLSSWAYVITGGALVVVVVIAAVEVTAPIVPVVVNGLRFKAKPEAAVPVAVLVAAAVVPGGFNPNPVVPRPIVPVEGAPSVRPVLVDEAGAEELAIDANSTGPVEPRRGAVLAAVVVDAVVVTPSLLPKDRVGPWLVLEVSVAVGAPVAAVEINDPKFRPEDCPPRLKGAAAGWAVLPKLVVVVVAAAAGAAPKVNPVGAACGAAVLVAPMLKPVVPA